MTTTTGSSSNPLTGSVNIEVIILDVEGISPIGTGLRERAEVSTGRASTSGRPGDVVGRIDSLA